MALAFSIAFLWLLRMGEVTKLRMKQLAILSPTLVHITFTGEESKGAQRKGEPESVAIRSRSVIACITYLKSVMGPDDFLIGGTYREKSLALIEAASFYGVVHDRLKPHGLRRGGATWFFSIHQSYDVTCAHGRWAHVPTCRIYIDQANIDLTRSELPALEKAKLKCACANLDSLLLKAFQ